MNAVDLFAGPGGWDLACHSLGFDPLGIEWDDAACATREAAGLRTLQGDVAAFDPVRVVNHMRRTGWERAVAEEGYEGPAPDDLTRAEVDVLLASPPCPTFSSAGKGAGARLTEIIEAALDDLAEGKDTRAARIEEAYAVLEPTAPHEAGALPESRSARKRQHGRLSPYRRARLARRRKVRQLHHREAENSLLVVEPLRWALALEPRFLAWEQVPPVLPFWERCAEIMRSQGWNVWTGKVEAERFGSVAQCPLHDPRPAPSAGSQFDLTTLASVEVAAALGESAPSARPASTYAAARDFASVAAAEQSTSGGKCPALPAAHQPTRGPNSASPAEIAAWEDWIQSAENAERQSSHAERLAYVGNAATAPVIGSTPTEALSDAWTVASLARAALDAASDATWRGHVCCLLSQALPELRTPRGRVAAVWTSAVMSGSGWTASTGESITWSPKNFWAALCALARSYIMSTKTRPTMIEATYGSSPATRITSTSIIRERLSTECSLCDDIAVPQTRERAILIADREGPVHPPRPTHQRYVKGEPRRHEMTLEGEVLPWVSMAEALGWIDGPEPSLAPTVSGGGTGSGGGVEIFAGKASRERARRSVAFRNGNQDNAAVREESEPAPTVAFGHNAARVEWVMEKKEDRPERKAQGAGNTPRSLAEPAATIDTRADLNRWASDRPAPTIVTTRRSKDGILVGRQLPEGEGENVGGHNWPSERPSTAVCGDPRISPPGYRGGKAEYAELGEGETPERSGANAIRVTLPEALILQSFPPDYPVQGSKSKRFQQVGNAVPPLLAHAILSALLAPVLSEQKPQALERSAAA